MAERPLYTERSFIPSRKWRNWQTHQLEGLALARAWGFESPLPHHHLTSLGVARMDGPGTRPSPVALGLRARVPPSAPVSIQHVSAVLWREHSPPREGQGSCCANRVRNLAAFTSANGEARPSNRPRSTPRVSRSPPPPVRQLGSTCVERVSSFQTNRSSSPTPGTDRDTARA